MNDKTIITMSIVTYEINRPIFSLLSSELLRAGGNYLIVVSLTRMICGSLAANRERDRHEGKRTRCLRNSF